MSLSNRKDYDRAFAVVRTTINEWDPHGLIAGGSPLDEWESEVASIVAQIPRIRSAKDAAHAVSRTFSGSLTSAGFSPADCEGVGTQLYQALLEANVIE